MYKEVVLKSKKEAMEVLDYANEVVYQYGFVSVADMYDLVGYKYTHSEDAKYGWKSIRDFSIEKCSEGYKIKAPKPLPID